MSNQHWHRDRPQFYNYMGMDRTTLDGPDGIAGLKGLLMSRDARSDSQSLLVDIPKGFKKSLQDKEGSLELFLIRGDLSFNGERVGPSGYVHVP